MVGFGTNPAGARPKSSSVEAALAVVLVGAVEACT
jgi:hypothetical protein